MTGIPDQWERIWSPYRTEYTEQLKSGEISCPFCEIPALPDDKSFILARGAVAYVVLNRYPYNPGHLLVCTFRHVGRFIELSDDEHEEITALTKSSLEAISKIEPSVNFNIGINQGRAAGAGIPDHFHQHIVPRWRGDSNFMPVIGGTKVLSQMLSETREILTKLWPK